MPPRCRSSLLMLAGRCLVVQRSPAASLGVLPHSTVSHCLLRLQLSPLAQLTSAAPCPPAEVTHCILLPAASPALCPTAQLIHSTAPHCPAHPKQCSPLPISPQQQAPLPTSPRQHCTPLPIPLAALCLSAPLTLNCSPLPTSLALLCANCPCHLSHHPLNGLESMASHLLPPCSTAPHCPAPAAHCSVC